jgi:hypothetical protein
MVGPGRGHKQQGKRRSREQLDGEVEMARGTERQGPGRFLAATGKRKNGGAMAMEERSYCSRAEPDRRGARRVLREMADWSRGTRAHGGAGLQERPAAMGVPCHALRRGGAAARL